ncbi:MAG: N-acetyltransferase [Candidatus Taylorbacteria bacterium]|nr:N-acetyltransferase [Candidatus Taylorbacteria bacterium]
METPVTKENIPIEIVEASEADIPTLLDLENSVANTKTYSAMLEENEWKEELKKGKVFIIRKNNEVVGNFSYEREGDDRVYISGLVINPAFQGQGIGREVLTKFLKEFEGVKRVDLVTHPDNKSALKLYESLGFVVESRRENYYEGENEPRLILVRKNT